VVNNLRKPVQCLVGIHLTTAIYEQPVVY